MKTIPLTQGKVAVVDDEDFEYLNQFKWCCNGGYAKRAEYVQYLQRVNKKRITISMHRIILRARPGQYCDHINGDPLDNRRANLRICTQSQNCMNRRKSKNNTSGYKGVCWCKRNKRWIAQITLDGNRIHIGYYSTAEEAAKAYNDKALSLFKEFICLDWP